MHRKVLSHVLELKQEISQEIPWKCWCRSSWSHRSDQPASACTAPPCGYHSGHLSGGGAQQCLPGVPFTQPHLVSKYPTIKVHQIHPVIVTCGHLPEGGSQQYLPGFPYTQPHLVSKFPTMKVHQILPVMGTCGHLPGGRAQQSLHGFPFTQRHLVSKSPTNKMHQILSVVITVTTCLGKDNSNVYLAFLSPSTIWRVNLQLSKCTKSSQWRSQLPSAWGWSTKMSFYLSTLLSPSSK